MWSCLIWSLLGFQSDFSYLGLLFLICPKLLPASGSLHRLFLPSGKFFPFFSV